MAQRSHFLLFDTAFGCCALAWSTHGLTAVRLPDASAALTRARLRMQLPQAQEWRATEGGAEAPDFVAAAVAAIQAHLAGQPRDLREVPLDLRGVQDFECRVYAATRAIDPGHTCSYGEMARRISEPAAMRAVGQALGHNPWPLVIPCHRVLAAGGRLGGFSAPGGSETKRRLLVLEAGMVRREGELF